MDRARLAAALLGSSLVTAFLSAPVQAFDVRPAADVFAQELNSTRFTLNGKALPDARYHPRPEGRVAAATPALGTQRQWLGLDDTTGKYYPKGYTLKAVGKHIEVWVADDLNFPAADCRKNAVTVTPAQIDGLVSEFDTNIYPKETAAFSTPPDRDGTRPTMAGDFTGDGDKTVTLVDNIRDENYYHFPASVTYTAGFFSPQLNELFDRNVMTIDAYDWLHRMGANPPDDPTKDLCTSRPAHPDMYEATFAHEWQHLLEYYQDPDEVTWVNEGLSDFAQTLTGYVDGSLGVQQRGFDNHLNCFRGWGPVKTRWNPNPRECGGPENSLNLWNEGAPNDILADYGNAYQFMIYLRDRFGLPIITALHRDGTHQGLGGVQAALPAGTNLYDVIHDFQTMTLVGKTVQGGTMRGVPIGRVTAPGLLSSINLANPADYAIPGAAPNGADYVPLPTPITSASFSGAKTLPALPTGWTIAGNTLFSGNAANLDNAAVLPVTVPTTNPVLTMSTAYAIEQGYDWAYVSLSTDGGKTYIPVVGDRTAAGPLGPGLTGDSGQTLTTSYDLKDWAGKKALLELRYVTDQVVNKGGWRIGEIELGGKDLSNGSTLDGWRSPSAIQPTAVHAWHVSLVGLGDHKAALVPLNQFAKLSGYPTVVAIIAYDEPTEKIGQYAPYTLTVNGKVQPGGGATTTP